MTWKQLFDKQSYFIIRLLEAFSQGTMIDVKQSRMFCIVKNSSYCSFFFVIKIILIQKFSICRQPVPLCVTLYFGPFCPLFCWQICMGAGAMVISNIKLNILHHISYDKPRLFVEEQRMYLWFFKLSDLLS